MVPDRFSSKGIRLSAIALIVLICGLGIYLSQRTYTIVIPQEQLQASLEDRFPITKTYFFLFTFQYANPRVILEEDFNRIQAGLDAEVSIQGSNKPFKGTVLVSGVPFYVRSQGKFIISDARVEKFSVEGVPQAYSGNINQMATVLLREYLDQQPLYQLNQTDLRQSFLKLTLKSIEVKDGNLVAKMEIGL